MSKIIEMYLSLVDKGKYPHQKEWYSKYNFHGKDFEELLDYKKTHLINIDLKTQENSLYFNEKLIIPVMKEYYDQVVLNIEHFDYFFDHIENILIFSEVEHSLEIEGIKSSRKKIESVMRQSSPKNVDEQVIYNMKTAIDFIRVHPISIESIHTLYQIVSKDSLKEDEKIEGLYRKDGVDIHGRYGEISDQGIDAKDLESWMEDLVAFINDHIEKKNELTYLVPMIVHYVLIYYHPYYDFNGRMARLLAYWFSLRCPFIPIKYPIFSEAINFSLKTKTEYYRSIEHSREDKNDLSFFLKTQLELATQMNRVYINLYAIVQDKLIHGIALSDNELSAIKHILMHTQNDRVFTWEQFHYFSKEQYSKQYTLRLLNGLVNKKVLSLKKTLKTHYYQLIMA